MTRTTCRTRRSAHQFGLLTFALAAGSLTAFGAERVVLCEEFMRTTCPYCGIAGPALDQMQSAYPDTFVLVQVHTQTYTTPWGNSRMSFYGITTVPRAEFDGATECRGAYSTVTQQYNWYNTTYLNRMSVPTDVTIDLHVVKVSDEARYVSADVGLEPGGTGKMLRINMVQVLDHWPSTPAWCRNAVKQGADAQDITLAPGESQSVTGLFTLDADSLASEGDVKFVVWAQVPNASAPAEVYNAALATGPFQFLTGDTNCDGVIGFSDINPFVLALTSATDYVARYPTCARLNADCNLDGQVDFGDINPFVALLTGPQ